MAPLLMKLRVLTGIWPKSIILMSQRSTMQRKNSRKYLKPTKCCLTHKRKRPMTNMAMLPKALKVLGAFSMGLSAMWNLILGTYSLNLGVQALAGALQIYSKNLEWVELGEGQKGLK